MLVGMAGIRCIAGHKQAHERGSIRVLALIELSSRSAN